jgi:hypothetical protein
MNASEPASVRAPRMKVYHELISELDSGGSHYSQDLSEVDLSDLDDVKVVANDPQGEVLVHLGSSNFLERYKIYTSHVREWRQQFAKLESVDLRYDGQIIVNPDLQGTVTEPPLSHAAAKAATAAGVKAAALVDPQPTTKKPTANVPPKSTATHPSPKSSLVKRKKNRRRKPTLKKASKVQVIGPIQDHNPRVFGPPAPPASGSSSGTTQSTTTATASANSKSAPYATTSSNSTTKPAKPSPAIPKAQGPE